MNKPLRSCIKCGWVHFGVSREYAENRVKEFNEYYETLSPKYKSFYSRASSIEDYESCLRCGSSYKDFRDSAPDNCPIGSTISPIIVE